MDFSKNIYVYTKQTQKWGQPLCWIVMEDDNITPIHN